MSEKERRVMSALGQKQTFAVQNVMSALPPKADIRGRGWTPLDPAGPPQDGAGLPRYCGDKKDAGDGATATFKRISINAFRFLFRPRDNNR